MRTKRIIVICEGETEQEFCKILARSLNIKIDTPKLGGNCSWERIKPIITKQIKSDTTATCVTTFIDYYGLKNPKGFPLWEDAHKINDKSQVIDRLEEGMKIEIEDERFIPYLQLHEFEALLFSDYGKVANNGLIDIDNAKELKKIIDENPNPETINNNTETSPAHRLEKIIKGYDKILYGSLLAEAVGLEKIREKNPRFNAWLEKLESL
ncbi:MAG: DUF4276 family protein [Bacteroidales bacterium]|jgi:hypothetical protein|nr:DUF4276 family protein [Bacteroidales bacterium]